MTKAYGFAILREHLGRVPNDFPRFIKTLFAKRYWRNRDRYIYIVFMLGNGLSPLQVIESGYHIANGMNYPKFYRQVKDIVRNTLQHEVIHRYWDMYENAYMGLTIARPPYPADWRYWFEE